MYILKNESRSILTEQFFWNFKESQNMFFFLVKLAIMKSEQSMK